MVKGSAVVLSTGLRIVYYDKLLLSFSNMIDKRFFVNLVIAR